MLFWLIVIVAVVLYFSIKSASNSTSKTQEIKPSLPNPNVNNRTSITLSTRIVSSSNHDSAVDDELVTFNISYGLSEEKSNNTTPGYWIKPGVQITINGQVISSGNFYFGGRLSSSSGYDTEASLVDDSLKIENAPSGYEDEKLGYWPKFISLSAKGRGAYISWLSSNRSDPETPLGYVFIYFYGLERRVTIDANQGAVSDLEFKSLFDEIVRLKDIYGESHSFSNYSTRLLELMCVLRPHVVSHSKIESFPQHNSILFKHRLATAVIQEKPIPVELALAWIRYYPEYNLRQPARRCVSEFKELFTQYYRTKYGDGIVVKPNTARLKIEYYPASPTLRGLPIPQQDLPDPSNLKGPVNKLIAIADDCTAKLDAYSRYLAKPNTSPTDIEAILLLPDELIDLGSLTALKDFKEWAESVISTRNGLVTVQEYWSFTKSPLPTKISKREAELIQNLAQKVGFGVAPDTRYHHSMPSIDGNLVLFSDGHGNFFEPSKAFNEVGMVLRFGAIVATINSHVDQAELHFLRNLIDHNTNLSPVEKRSLYAYLIWRLNTTPNITGLKARVELLGISEKAAVSRVLVRVAMADGKIEPGEIKQLEKLYTLLSIDKSLVTRDIHELSLERTGLKDNGTGLRNNTHVAASFKLDENILSMHESETKDVQSILSAIFVDDETISESIEIATESDVVNEINGIDKLHYALFESLTQRDNWTREEAEALCRISGLMLSGAIETINDWSFDKVNAAVIEDNGDTIWIDQEIVEEIES